MINNDNKAITKQQKSEPMIEIQAKLLRGPVYFAEETIECLVTLRNVPSQQQQQQFQLPVAARSREANGTTSTTTTTPTDALTSAGETTETQTTETTTSEVSNSEKTTRLPPVERLCWANVQLHCFCLVDESQVNEEEIAAEASSITSSYSSSSASLGGSQISLRNQSTTASSSSSFSSSSKRSSFALETYASTDTSFHECLLRAERGTIVYASAPKILFCDLTLAPWECQTFVYTETLPRRLNPSYSSPRLKYTYKLTVGAQRIGAPIHLLKMPLRILSALGFDTALSGKMMANGDSNANGDDSSSLKSNNNFDDESRDESTPLDLALHRIEAATCHRVPHSFNITSGGGAGGGNGRRVARFSIFKTAYRLGEDVVGVFNFGEGSVPCIRYSVALQTEETLSERFSKSSSSSSSGRPAVINVVNHGRCGECTLNTVHSQVVLTIPLTATPTFANDIVSLEWKLHFRFVISSSPEQAAPLVYSRTEEAVQRVAPRELAVQVMTWDFPIKVLGTHPAHVAKGFQMASIGSLNI